MASASKGMGVYAMAAETAEVVIIGAGVMGASLAFHLTQRGVRDVLLLEKASVGAGASSKTGALLRQHYTNVTEATLVHRSVQTFAHWAEIVGGECGYDRSGLIATVYQSGPDDPNVARMVANVAMQRARWHQRSRRHSGANEGVAALRRRFRHHLRGVRSRERGSRRPGNEPLARRRRH